MVEVAAGLPTPDGPVPEERLNALMVEDRTPHLAQVEVRPWHCMGVQSLPLFGVRLSSSPVHDAMTTQCLDMPLFARFQIRVKFLKNVMSNSALRLSYEQVVCACVCARVCACEAT